jgi:hypothetical protein
MKEGEHLKNIKTDTNRTPRKVSCEDVNWVEIAKDNAGSRRQCLYVKCIRMSQKCLKEIYKTLMALKI